MVAAEHRLLTRHGHEVRQYQAHNDEIDLMPAWDVALKTFWNTKSYGEMQGEIDDFQPDVIHVHNTFPLISPSVYYAATRRGVPVIQTLHNFRLICPGSTLYRDGKVCEECLHSIAPYPAAIHRCYRNSFGASATTAGMLTAHRIARTWTRHIHTYIALTETARRKFVEGGLPADKITVKSNFISQDPGYGTGDGGFALYVGRLAEEKGIRTLLQAWEQKPEMPLMIVGDGPLRELVLETANRLPQVRWLGQCSHAEALRLLKEAFALIVPSVWYEGALPLTIIEAAACGTPVLNSDLGSMGDWAAESGLGIPFAPGDAFDLARQFEALTTGARRIEDLRLRMRAHYLAHYTAEQNYGQLMAVYENAVGVQQAAVADA